MRTTSGRPMLGVVAAGIFATALLIGSVTPASASTTPTPATTQTPIGYHPWLDWAGAQFAKHEPVTVTTARPRVSGPLGLDVSSYQGNIDWSTVAANGAKFAYTKATEGTDYTNPYFAQQYNGSYSAGLIRGAYHFALMDVSSGAAQADYFVANGGGWSKDGKTLPGMADLEWDPYKLRNGTTNACYGLSQSQVAGWIGSFANEYHAKTSRWPVMYTATSWWNQCVGTAGAFAGSDPLIIADPNGSPGALPYNWQVWTIWQYGDSGTFPGDQDVFNGDYSGIQALANG